jgi:hypothetical protein
MFAARGGAARVVGVDGSKGIAELATQVGWEVAVGARRLPSSSSSGAAVAAAVAAAAACVAPWPGAAGRTRGAPGPAERRRLQPAPPPPAPLIRPPPAPQNLKTNQLHTSQGGPVSVVHGKLEELEGLDGLQQVDVIVSEWMGYALLFETMLDTVGGVGGWLGWVGWVGGWVGGC